MEKGMVTHSSILVWRILMDRGTCWATFHGVAKCPTPPSSYHFAHGAESGQGRVGAEPDTMLWEHAGGGAGQAASAH